jgi:hypothetical protein
LIYGNESYSTVTPQPFSVAKYAISANPRNYFPVFYSTGIDKKEIEKLAKHRKRLFFSNLLSSERKRTFSRQESTNPSLVIVKDLFYDQTLLHHPLY